PARSVDFSMSPAGTVAAPMSRAGTLVAPAKFAAAFAHLHQIGCIRLEQRELRGRSTRIRPWAESNEKRSCCCEGKQSHFHFRAPEQLCADHGDGRRRTAILLSFPT